MRIGKQMQVLRGPRQSGQDPALAHQTGGKAMKSTRRANWPDLRTLTGDGLKRLTMSCSAPFDAMMDWLAGV